MVLFSIEPRLMHVLILPGDEATEFRISEQSGTRRHCGPLDKAHNSTSIPTAPSTKGRTISNYKEPLRESCKGGGWPNSWWVLLTRCFWFYLWIWIFWRNRKELSQAHKKCAYANVCQVFTTCQTSLGPSHFNFPTNLGYRFYHHLSLHRGYNNLPKWKTATVREWAEPKFNPASVTIIQTPLANAKAQQGLDIGTLSIVPGYFMLHSTLSLLCDTDMGLRHTQPSSHHSLQHCDCKMTPQFKATSPVEGVCLRT